MITRIQLLTQITLIQAHWLSLMVCELFIIKSKLVNVCIIVRVAKHDLCGFNSNYCDSLYRVIFNYSSRCSGPKLKKQIAVEQSYFSTKKSNVRKLLVG